MKNMNKQLLVASALLLPAIVKTEFAKAQAPFNTISGKVWQDSRIAPDGLIGATEPGIPGVLVVMYKTSAIDTVVSSTISTEDGNFEIENFVGEGEYFLQFHFPTQGYNVTAHRVGTDNSINNSASDLDGDEIIRTENITITAADNGLDLGAYNLGLIMQPNKIVYSTFKSNTSTEWRDTLSLPKSSELNGDLSRVKLFLTNAAHHPTIGIENISTTSGSTGSVDLGGKIVVTPPNNVISSTGLNALTSIQKSGVYPVFDGTSDYGGLSGSSWNNEFGAAFDDYNYPNSQRGHFEGEDSVRLPLVASSAVTITGGGNLSSNVTTLVSAGVFVIYEYDDGVLPVALANFDVKKENTVARISWNTVSEQNNLGFYIQRSTDGKSFTDLGLVTTLATGGNSTEFLSYNFTDNMPLTGKNIYRLKQVDIDGKSSLSSVKIIYFNEAGQAEMFPNPAYENVTVYAQGLQQISVADITGKLVTVPVSLSGDNAILDLKSVTAGLYNIIITKEDGTTNTMRLIKK